jgi:dihydroorotate dehydrogenase
VFEKFIHPVIGKLDLEAQHLAILDMLHIMEGSYQSDTLFKELVKCERFTDKRLQVNIAGIVFDNPLLVGAGWDKVGRAVKALYQLGFAGVEVGTVSLHPQLGNPQPRHFIPAPGVSLNRYGFNTPGVEVVALNLEQYRRSNIPIGISLGKNKTVPNQDAPEAYAVVAKRLYQHATYFAINVSSPNTSGLRALQEKEHLTRIVQAVFQTTDNLGGRKPVFVKIAPDLSYEAVDDVIRVITDNRITGIIATNTTSSLDIKAKYGEQWRNEMEGISGDDADFRKMATDMIKHIYRQTGDKLIIIGAGGIKDTKTALEKIRAGASALQVVAALDEEGPTLPGKINRGIVGYMEKEGVKSISELVGVDVK